MHLPISPALLPVTCLTPQAGIYLALVLILIFQWAKGSPKGDNWLVLGHIENELSFILKSTLLKVKSMEMVYGVRLPFLRVPVPILTHTRSFLPSLTLQEEGALGHG